MSRGVVPRSPRSGPVRPVGPSASKRGSDTRTTSPLAQHARVLMSLSSDQLQEDSVRTLCADVGVEYRDLDGPGLDERKLALVTIFSSKGELDVLEAAVGRTRSIKMFEDELPPSSARKPIALFVSYSHKDEKWRAELEMDLEKMVEDGLIEAWHDGKILAGDQFDAEIRQNIDAAHIILLLVSRRFLGSKYIRNVEVPAALKRHEAGQAQVIPIILAPSAWKEFFGEMKVLPKDGKPIVKWKVRDDALLEVYESVRETVAKLAKTSGGGE